MFGYHKRYCLTCDLVDDPKLMAEYKDWHTRVWPKILSGIKKAGVSDMQIYNYGNRMFMIMEVTKKHSWEKMAKMDAKKINKKW